VYASDFIWQIKTPDKSAGLPQGWVYNGLSFIEKVLKKEL
jgi:hypothetical protein